MGLDNRFDFAEVGNWKISENCIFCSTSCVTEFNCFLSIVVMKKPKKNTGTISVARTNAVNNIDVFVRFFAIKFVQAF